ncbi:MAG: hypothetical protein ACOY0R_04225, partial [Chloroflexota bacterium]
HLTLGILRTSQAVFYALSFFWLDGFAVPAPAQVPINAGVCHGGCLWSIIVITMPPPCKARI